jgi:hypothetical protein
MSETMIHPETGAILRRRKRIETVTYQGQSRTVEVEGWFPADDGDGIFVGADSKPLDDALAEMKAGWPGKPGVPLNPEQGGWHGVLGHSPADKPRPELWSRDQAGFFWWSGMQWREDKAAKHWTYLGPVLFHNEATALQAENARLREALDFYGDVSKYPAPFTGGMGALWEDCGKIARAARGEKE